MTFRLYFNCKEDFPLVWSFDRGIGTEEYKVVGAKLHRVTGRTVFDPHAGDNVKSPTAWVEITYAVAEVRDNVVHFFRDPSWRIPQIVNTEEK